MSVNIYDKDNGLQLVSGRVADLNASKVVYDNGSYVSNELDTINEKTSHLSETDGTISSDYVKVGTNTLTTELSALEWKTLVENQSASSTTSLSGLNFKELIVKVSRGTEQLYCSFYLIKNQLSTDSQTFISGGYIGSGGTQMAIKVNLSNITISGIYFNGTEIKTKCFYTVYYR